MGRPLKILLTLIVAVVLGIGAIVVFLPVFFDPNDFKTEIIDTVKEKTGMNLELSGDIKLSIFPWLGVSAEKVSLKNSAAFQNRPLLSVEESDVKVKLMPLLAKKIEINSIVLKGLRLYLEKNEQGLGNWEELTANFKMLEQEKRLKGPAESVPSETSSYLSTLTVDRFSIEGSKIKWDNRQTGKRIDINEVNLNADGFGFNRPVNVGMSFVVDEVGRPFKDTVDLNSTLNVDDKLEHGVLSDSALKFVRKREGTSGRAWPGQLIVSRIEIDRPAGSLTVKSAQLQFYDAVLAVNFDVNGLFNQPLLQGSVALSPLNLAQFLKQLKLKVPAMQDADALHSLEMKMNVSADAGNAALNDIALVLDETRITGKAQIKNFSEPAFSFNLNADNVDVDRYLSPKLDKSKTLTSPAAALAAGFSLVPAAKLRNLDANGELLLNKLKVKGLAMQDVLLEINTGKGLISTKQSAKGFYEGSYNGELSLDLRKDDAVVSVNEQIGHARLDSLLKGFGHKARARGMLDASWQLQGRAARAKVIKSSLNGRFDFFLKDGAIRGFNLERAIESAKAIAKKGDAPLPIDNRQETSFSMITGTGSVNGGVLKSNDLVARSSNFKIEGKGSADLNTDRLDYILTAKLLKNEVTPDAPEQYHKTPVLIKIGGTFDEPDYKLDISSLLTENNKAKIKKFLNKNENKINKFLKKLNKRFGVQTN